MFKLKLNCIEYENSLQNKKGLDLSNVFVETNDTQKHVVFVQGQFTIHVEKLGFGFTSMYRYVMRKIACRLGLVLFQDGDYM